MASIEVVISVRCGVDAHTCGRGIIAWGQSLGATVTGDMPWFDDPTRWVDLTIRGEEEAVMRTVDFAKRTRPVRRCIHTRATPAVASARGPDR